jgi:phosphotriesterase-related protein
MSWITTVLGDIRPEELGFTSMHEHTVCDMQVFRTRYEALIPADVPVKADDPVRLDNLGVLKHAFILSKEVMDLTDEKLIASEISDFAAAGGRAMLDASVPGVRCDINAVRRISEMTGVHIIASTGLYVEDSWPDRFRNMETDDYLRFMMGEINDGIDGTGIKAGHIKIGITDSSMFSVQPFSAQQKKLLKASIKASNETGLSLTIHPPLDRFDSVRDVVRFMLDSGANPERVVIAHNDLFIVCMNLVTLISDPSSWQLDIDCARELLDLGFNISFDSFGHWHDAEPVGDIIPYDWQRLAALAQLIKLGYSSQIVLGTDMFLKILFKRYGGDGYCRVLNFALPMLRQAGVAEEDITKMTIGNPARILSRNK